MNNPVRREKVRATRAALVVFLVTAMLLSIALLVGCGDSEDASEEESKPEWMQTTIYFGANIPGGGAVSEEDFGKFLEEVVTPEFPAGLTMFDSYGQMEDDTGTIQKQVTKVVLLVHEKSKENEEKVDKVIDSYRKRFSEPQVMKTTYPVDVEFFQMGTPAATDAPSREEVVAFTNEALEYARENGKDKALAAFTDQNGEFKRGELYIYAYDFNGNVLAHGGDPSLVGQDLIDYEDPNGVKVIQKLIEIAKNEGSGWLSYTWENPETTEQEPKHGFVVKVDDTWWLGSGTYD